MFLFELFLAFIGITLIADSSPPKLNFQQLLDRCSKPNSNSTQCQTFFSSYPWRNDDIRLVFKKISSWRTGNGEPPLNILEERLVHLIENPNFNLESLGEHSFYFAAVGKNEPLAIAIWPHLAKYKNQNWDSYLGHVPTNHLQDLQLYECYYNLEDHIIRNNLLQILEKMVTDQPDCLLQCDRTIQGALLSEPSRAMREFIFDHVELLPEHFKSLYLSPEGFEWALLNYRHSNNLIKNSITEGHEDVAIAMWEFLKQKKYKDLLFNICNSTVFDVVKKNKVQLLKTMLRGCPDCIQSNGHALMDIAINGDQDFLPMIQLLNLYGVEISPLYLHKEPSLQYTGYPHRFNLTHLINKKYIRDKFGRKRYHGAVYHYLRKAVERNEKEINNKILALGFADIWLKGEKRIIEFIAG